MSDLELRTFLIFHLHKHVFPDSPHGVEDHFFPSTQEALKCVNGEALLKCRDDFGGSLVLDIPQKFEVSPALEWSYIGVQVYPCAAVYNPSTREWQVTGWCTYFFDFPPIATTEELKSAYLQALNGGTANA